MNLGAIERKPDTRDVQLGSVQTPLQIPAHIGRDVSWLIPNYQGDLPTCGAHAASHLKAILEHDDDPTVAQRYTPRYIWAKIKAIDGFPLDAGTDMRSIFKALANSGAADFEPLENDVTLPLTTYSSGLIITPAMDANAAEKKILSYAFDNTTIFDTLKQRIFRSKAILVLLKVSNNGWWGSDVPQFNTPDDGHFVCAYDYDDTYLYIVDSSDKVFPFKKIHKQYITSTFFREAGTALDIPKADLLKIVQSASQVTNEVVNAPLTPAQKFDLLGSLKNLLSLIASFFPGKGRGKH